MANRVPGTTAAIAGRRWLAGVAGLALIGLAGCQTRVCSSQPLAVLPLLDEPSGLYVRAVVDGHALKLLLDTGSTRTLLTSGTARQLGLRVEHLLDDTDVLDGFAINGVGGRRHIDRAWPKRIELGLAPIIATPVSVVWSGDASWDAAGDGILGMDLLAKYDVDLDVARQRIALFAPGAMCPPADAAHARALQAQADAADGPWVMATISGVAFRTLIDTGAQRSFVMAGAAARLGGAAVASMQDQRFDVVGVGSAHEAAVLHSFDQVVVGNVSIPKLEMAMTGSLRGPGIILGDDVLRLVHIWMMAAGGLYIAPA